MTRRKKSRKPGPLAPAKKPKDTSASVDSSRGKKKGKGLKPGQRHSSTATKQSVSQSGSQQPDPRKGSRRKIPLVSVASAATVSQLTPAEELKRLEQDETLQALVTRFEEGEELSDAEQQYLDEKSERYEQLATELGIDLEDDDDWDDEEY